MGDRCEPESQAEVSLSSRAQQAPGRGHSGAGQRQAVAVEEGWPVAWPPSWGPLCVTDAGPRNPGPGPLLPPVCSQTHCLTSLCHHGLVPSVRASLWLCPEDDLSRDVTVLGKWGSLRKPSQGPGSHVHNSGLAAEGTGSGVCYVVGALAMSLGHQVTLGK